MAPQFIPHRNDIIMLDKYRPALVLSSKEYNKQSGLLICCPISTSIRGAFTEVPITNLTNPSVVTANLIQTLSWKERHTKLITKAKDGVLEEVLMRLLPLIGATQFLSGSD